MRAAARSPVLLRTVFTLLAASLSAAAWTQVRDGERAPVIDETTGKRLNEAIEQFNGGDARAARDTLGKLRLDRLAPYERSRVEQILASIEIGDEQYPEARGHLQAAIDSGGLNEQEFSEMRYRIAQTHLAEENWRAGAAALETWFDTAVAPNSAAYYLLAAAYYQMNDYARALPPAEQAVALSEQPQEGWLQLLLALHLEREDYTAAIRLLERLAAQFPGRKNYWLQLSSVYGQLEEYPQAFAVMQLAHDAGLLSQDAEFRRLADLAALSNVPYRAGQTLETALLDGVVVEDAKLFDKLGTAWMAAREFDRAVEPLERAAHAAESGDPFVRLGEVHVQREAWQDAGDAFRQALAKGGLRDAHYAELMLGITLYNTDRFDASRPWFERARASERFGATAHGYLQAIDNR